MISPCSKPDVSVQVHLHQSLGLCVCEGISAGFLGLRGWGDVAGRALPPVAFLLFPVRCDALWIVVVVVKEMVLNAAEALVDLATIVHWTLVGRLQALNVLDKVLDFCLRRHLNCKLRKILTMKYLLNRQKLLHMQEIE